LGELGHLVYYSVAEGYAAPLPWGVVAGRRDADADIYHFSDYPTCGAPPPPGKPWLRTFQAAFDVRGHEKALVDEHFVFVSKAHAESFGATRYVWNGIDPVVSRLTRAEGKGLLTAGTPVLGSRRGSLPELVTPEVGFICDSVEDYIVAAERLDRIRPADCRRRAMTEFHYLAMTQRYLAEYERELGSERPRARAGKRSGSGAERVGHLQPHTPP
jgi:hypothetical protein